MLRGRAYIVRDGDEQHGDQQRDLALADVHKVGRARAQQHDDPAGTEQNTARADTTSMLKHARLIFTYILGARMSDYLYQISAELVRIDL